MKRAHEEGPNALRPHPPPGAPRRLSAEQLARLPELLQRGPEAYGCRGELWTRGRTAAVSQLESGIASHPRHPKGAEVQQQTILFRDDSGFYPLPSVVRTDAPVGHTPIVREWCTRDHLSAISAISPEGKLYFHAEAHAIDSAAVVACFGASPPRGSRPDDDHLGWRANPSPSGHPRLPRQWPAQRVHLERLPASAPELNPGEGLWPQLKGVELRHVCCFNIPHLRHE